jgi:hypothetical protein
MLECMLTIPNIVLKLTLDYIKFRCKDEFETKIEGGTPESRPAP